MTDPWLKTAEIQTDPWLKAATKEPEPEVPAPTPISEALTAVEQPEISVEPSPQDIETYKRMGVKQYRSPAGKPYDFTPQKERPTFEAAPEPGIGQRIKDYFREPQMPVAYDLPEGRKYRTLPPTREEQPLRSLAELGAYGLGQYGVGKALYTPELITERPVEKLTARISAAELTPKEKRIGETLKFIGGLKTAGQILRPVIATFPTVSQQAVIGGAGVFGLRNITEQLVNWARTGKKPSLEAFEKDTALGALFGAGEVGVRKFIGFVRGLGNLKKGNVSWTNIKKPKDVAEAIKHFQKTGDKSKWEAIRVKYAGITEEGATRIKARAEAIPSAEAKVKEFGKYPLARAGEPVRPPTERPVVPKVGVKPEKGIKLPPPPKPIRAKPVAPVAEGKVKITDRIDKLKGVEKSFWKDQELTVYYDEKVPKEAINVRVQKELTDKRLIGSVKKINLLSTEKGTFTPTPSALERKPAKEAWEMTFAEYYASEVKRVKDAVPSTKKAALFGPNIKQFHKGTIEDAVQQNKPVPPEVLEEYKSEEWARRALRAKLKKEVGVSGRKKILQERIRRGEPVPAKLLQEYKSEKWAQEALKEKPVKPKLVDLGPAPKVKVEGVPKELESLAKKAQKLKTANTFVRRTKLSAEEVTAMKAAGFIKKETRGKLPNLRAFWQHVQETKPIAKEKEFEIEPGKFYTQAKIDEAITKGEMGEIEIEPALETKSNSFNKHIEYFQGRQLPETSQIRKIQKQMQVVNGQRLAGTITAKEANKKIQQLKKVLFETAEKEGIALRMTKGGKVSVAVRKAGTYVPVEFAEYGKFKDIYPRAQDVTRSIQQIDGALSVKEKKKMPGQVGAAERNILWPTREMYMQKDKYRKEKAAQLKKILPVKEGSKEDTRINDVLEKIAKADRNKPIKDVLSAKTIKAMGAKPSDVKQAVELRKFYDDLIDEQNIARRIRDQEEIRYRHNYSPNILRDATIWERITMTGKTAEDVFGKKAPIPDYIRPNKPFNPREMARKAGIRYEERITSATELAGRYLSTAAKDIFNTSIIQNNKAFIQQLEAMGYERPAKYLADWTSQAYAGIMPSLDRAILLGETPKARKAMMKWNQVRNLAVFPLNVGWTLGTQIKSLGMTLGRYGVPNTYRGFRQWLNPSIRRQGAEDYYSFIVKSAKQGKVTRQDAKNLIGEEVKLRRTKREMARDLTTLFLEEMEKLLTGTSIRAAHLHGKKRGLTGEALKNYASDGGAKTQSMYNDEDKPLFLTNLTVKTVTPYQTYCYETMNTLREWAGRTGTPPDSKMYAVWSLVRYLAAMAVLNQIEASVRGRKWSWLRLVPMPFAELWLSPIYKHFTKEWLPGGSGLLSPVETASRLAKGVDDVLETGSWRKLRNELVKYGPGLFKVPAGVQWARLMDAIIAYSQGGVRDRRGKLLFKMKDPQDLARAIFTGVWTTKGGREYIEKRTGKKQEGTRKKRMEREKRMLRK